MDKWLLDIIIADMAELADAPDLGSGVNRRAGSTPVIRTRESVVNQGFTAFFNLTYHM